MIKEGILKGKSKSLEQELNDVWGKESQVKSRTDRIGPLVKIIQHHKCQEQWKKNSKRNRKPRKHAIITVQGAMRNKIARNKTIKHFEDQVAKEKNTVSALRSNFNEQRSEGLRKAKKALLDRKAEINTRGPIMDREQKKGERRN